MTDSKGPKKPDTLIQLKETFLIPDGEPETVIFGEGRLGVQIADINGKILVSCFEDNPDGTPGQAERSGIVKFGSQITAVSERSCVGMNMKELRKLVAAQPRPIRITFQAMKTSSGAPLLKPPNALAEAKPGENTTRRDAKSENQTRTLSKSPSRLRLISMIRNASSLETAGQPFSVRFRSGVIGLKIASARDRVLVSGFERAPGNIIAQAERVRVVEVGDQVVAVGDQSCLNMDYRGVARLVAGSPRPVTITFQPVRLADPDARARVLCPKCAAINWNTSAYCRMCGSSIPLHFSPSRPSRDKKKVPVVIKKVENPGPFLPESLPKDEDAEEKNQEQKKPDLSPAKPKASDSLLSNYMATQENEDEDSMSLINSR